MKKDQKETLIKNFIAKYGLSFKDPEVLELFYGERKNHVEQIERDYRYGSGDGVIRPSIISVLPMAFENSGYAHSGNDLYTWIMYDNAQANSLVFDNLGKFNFDIIKSFEQIKQREPAIYDREGNLFNNGDGNHRLLTLILQYFVESRSAKSQRELEAIERKYTLTIPVHYMHPNALIDLLNDNSYEMNSSNQNSVYPYAVRQYREQIMSTKELFVTYDPKSKIYTYSCNGEIFKGKDSELINYLKRKEPSDIMTWEKDGTYYISSNNFVIKTKDKNLYENKLKEFKNLKNNKKTPYLVVRDLDKKTYDIVIPPIAIAKIENRKRFISYFVSNMFENNKFIAQRKSNVDMENLIKNINSYAQGDIFYLDSIRFQNLTKEEYEKLLPNIEKECELLKDILNKDETIHTRGSSRFKFN